MARTVKKNAQGYGYTYTDLAEITKVIGESGYDYYQYIEPVDGVDYIMTVKIDTNNMGQESKPIRGCRVVDAELSGKKNPVQEYGAALTYCRRYSLLMAFGFATTDDDAQCCTQEFITKKEQAVIKELCKKKGLAIEDVFPKGLALTPEQYVEATKQLSKVPDLKRDDTNV